MTFKKDIWTYLLVSAVTVLIWIWAAGETRDSRALYVSLEFSPPDPDGWVVQSSHNAVMLTVEGSKRALDRAAFARNEPIDLVLGADGVPGEAGRHAVDVAATLSLQQRLRETGVVVLSSDPPTIDLDVDQIVRVPADIRVSLPGVRTEGEITVEPEQATLAMPAELQSASPTALTVEASVDPARLARLEPGREHAIEVALRLRDDLRDNPLIRIEPPMATINFTIRSRIAQVTLDRVRVQLAGPPESYSEYRVELAETVLRDVTVMADDKLIQQIERGEATVVAILHVSNRDKENAIDRKPVSYFVALPAGTDGPGGGVFVDAMVGNSTEMPAIGMAITVVE